MIVLVRQILYETEHIFGKWQIFKQKDVLEYRLRFTQTTLKFM